MMCERCKKEMSAIYFRSMIRDDFDLLDIASIMEEQVGITRTFLKSKQRNRKNVGARIIFCKLAAEFTNASLPLIGQFIDRDHTTVMYLKDKVLPREYQEIYNLVRKRIRSISDAITSAKEKYMQELSA